MVGHKVNENETNNLHNTNKIKTNKTKNEQANKKHKIEKGIEKRTIRGLTPQIKTNPH